MISPVIRRWPALPFSLTRTTSTAARVSPTSTTAWRRVCAKLTAGFIPATLARALELLGGLEDGEAVAKQIAAEVEKQSGLWPVLADDNGYHAYEGPELAKYVPGRAD